MNNEKYISKRSSQVVYYYNSKIKHPAVSIQQSAPANYTHICGLLFAILP